MVWILIGGFLGFFIVVWARASRRRFEAEQTERREQSRRVRLDVQEAELLSRLRAKKED